MLCFIIIISYKRFVYSINHFKSMHLTNVVLLVLASDNFESLQLTLRSLDHTLINEEKVVVILNGNNSLNARIVEFVAQKWCREKPDLRFAVRPLCAPAKPFYAIKEIIANSRHFKDAEYVCKIDDDIIPLKSNWLQVLANHYASLSKELNIGFVTGLINNNCWGFKELVFIYNKKTEYSQIHSYNTVAGWQGVRTIKPGEIDDGDFGTIWHYPFIARWVHEWTSVHIDEFLQKTAGLNLKQIPLETYYSIGCILFKKEFWTKLSETEYSTEIDERIIHRKCLENKWQKWAVMNEPFIHLFYNNHKIINLDILEPISHALANYFNNEGFIQDRVLIEKQFSSAFNQQLSLLNEDIILMKERIQVFFENVEIVS